MGLPGVKVANLTQNKSYWRAVVALNESLPTIDY
jgi:hypothetical protein